MAHTLTGTYNSLYTLADFTDDNPLTIAATAQLNAGLYVTNAGTWTVTNYGTIANAADGAADNDRTAGAAAAFASYSTLVNASGGSIGASGSFGVGVYMLAGGSVTNAGTISATGSSGYGVNIITAAGTVTNAGTITAAGYGIVLQAGGSVSNQAHGLIQGGGDGIDFSGGASATLSNYGTITSTGATGVYIYPSGTVTNGTSATISGSRNGLYLYGGGTVTNQAGGLIQGGSGDGINFGDNASGTLSNYGTVISTAATGVYFYLSGTVTNGASATISGGDDGIYMRYGGYVSNAAGGLIQGGSRDGIDFGTYDSGTLSNYGTIISTARTGVYLYQNGGVTNGAAATISGAAAGLYLENAGSVSNAAGGLIQGGSREGINFGDYGTGTLSNYGTVISTGASGVYLYQGAVTNGNSATISGAGAGVLFDYGGSVSNQSGGLIQGGAGDGINFGRYNNGTLGNDGTVTSTAANGVYLYDGGVTNGTSATISGAGDGVVFGYGGSVSNQSGGLIQGGTGDGVRFGSGGSSSLGNDGTVTSTGAIGVYLYAGAVTNGSSATISGATGGVYFDYGGSVQNQTGATIQGGIGISFGSYDSAYGTLGNQGTVIGGKIGVYLYNGAVTNALGALISASSGVRLGGGTDAVYNAGSIAGTSNGPSAAGVYFYNYGYVSNASTGTISSGNIGVWFYGNDGNGASLVNAGAITSSGVANIASAVYFFTNGTGTNQAGGHISASNVGVWLYQGNNSFTNDGTIQGGADAVRFGYHYNDNRLIADPGAVFIGTVDGGDPVGSGYYNTLELASGASAGSIGGLGSQFTNFEQITIDANAAWTFSGSNTVAAGVTLVDSGTLVAGALVNNGVILLDPSRMKAELTGTGSVTIGSNSTLEVYGTVAAGETIVMTGTNDFLQIDSLTGFSGTITGFAATDVIDVEGVGLAQSARIGNFPDTHALTLYSGVNGAGTQLFSFPYIATITGGEGAVAQGLTFSADTNNGTLIACYLRGTRIRTSRGEVAVEFLSAGDLVETLTGLAPIRWIGRRRYALATTEGHAAVLPVLIRAGAIGDGLPRRDLCVSPEHALCIDGVLVPARHLTNGNGIVRRRDLEVVEYFHLELAEHAVIFAEGMPAETFVDCDSRAMFDNASSYTGGGAPAWRFCAPRVEEGPALEDIRARINARAGIVHASGVGPLIGRLERMMDGSIEGWAQDARAPERPVWLEIIADGAVVASVLANRHRNDLEAAGLGSGRHAFRAALARQPRCLEARRAADGALLGALTSSNAARLPVSR